MTVIAGAVMSVDLRELVAEFSRALGGDGGSPDRRSASGEPQAGEPLARLSGLLDELDAVVRQRCGGESRIEVSDTGAGTLSATLSRPHRKPLEIRFTAHGGFVTTQGLDARDDRDVMNPAREDVFREGQIDALLTQVAEVARTYFATPTEGSADAQDR